MLRNTAGHGDIEVVQRSNRKFYLIEHMYKQKIKLYGQIKAADFWKLHKALVSLKSIRRCV